MVGSKGTVVVTTIQRSTPSLDAMAAAARAQGAGVVVVGDRKTPDDAPWPPGCDYWSLQRQQGSPWKLGAALPQNHYARKNIGYLAAMTGGAAFIYDTDDDNAPETHWRVRTRRADAARCLEGGWVNAYAWFTREHVWPRGLPLPFAHAGRPPAATGAAATVDAPIQQGLANGSPDVDAVWRLLQDRVLRFDDAPSVLLPPGSWCPFNSQSTWWFAEAYPLLYLPSHVSFRMTDIWRSFVAQRCLWAMGHGVVFHAAEVFQDRNEHNLMRDFEQEVPGYLHNERFRAVLEALDLPGGAGEAAANLHRCYEALVREQLVPAIEMPLVEAWLADLGAVK